jgi:hypothetical protein
MYLEHEPVEGLLLSASPVISSRLAPETYAPRPLKKNYAWVNTNKMVSEQRGRERERDLTSKLPSSFPNQNHGH